MKLILASASPRRKELLAKTGLTFDIIPAKGEEIVTKTIPAEVVMELSLQKAKEIADKQTEPCIVIGSDTVVAKGDEIFLLLPARGMQGNRERRTLRKI